MYIPPKFRIDDPEMIRAFIMKHPFGLLLSVDGGQIHDTHTPFVQAGNGKLLGHIAKANPQWRGWSTQNRVKAIFTGPHAYISPRHYVSEFAVPTWNYATVSISGRISIMENEGEVLDFLDLLVAEYETADEPWTLDRGDERYMNLLSGIVAFSIAIESVDASFKLSQNKSEEDQRKVRNALSTSGCPFDQELASMMDQTTRRCSGTNRQTGKS